MRMFQIPMTKQSAATRGGGAMEWWSIGAWVATGFFAVSFHAAALGAQVSPEGQLQVEIVPFPDERSIYHNNPVIIRFTNWNNKAVKLLRPLDGSEWCWHMPHYRFTVVDSVGNSLSLMPRCGNSGLWAELKWPDDYIIQILPGDSYEMQVGIPQKVSASGDYKVTFEYMYDPEVKSKARITYPDGLWQGQARSKDATLKLKASK